MFQFSSTSSCLGDGYSHLFHKELMMMMIWSSCQFHITSLEIVGPEEADGALKKAGCVHATRGFFFFSRQQAANQLLLFSNRISWIFPRQGYWTRTSHVEGRQLTVHEPEEAQIPTDVEEHGDCEPKQGRKPPSSSTLKSHSPRNLRAMTKVRNYGDLPAQVNYLLDFGFSPDRIKDIIRRSPNFIYYSLDTKIKPFVEFLVELGVPESGILHIIFKHPGLCALSLSENILPTMKCLEFFGINKSQWAKVIHRSPPLLTLSVHKIKACVDFLAELGLSKNSIGKLLTRFPSIVCCSVEDKLRPTALYFKSLGISPSMLIQRAPHVFGLSIEAKLKPTMNFFLDKGFSMDEVILMISRFGSLYTYSLRDNIQPKWEFFLTTGYNKSELIKHPPYFGYSLEGRIKPRISRMVSCGVRVPFTSLLSKSDLEFEKLIQKRSKGSIPKKRKQKRMRKISDLECT